MTCANVLDIYNRCKESGIIIWIDGGWGVDALLGKIMREHSDLDIAVHRKDNAKLRQSLESDGYREEKRFDSSEFMYVMKNEVVGCIDIHAFEYDENGNNIYGVKYPFGSLTGKGIIDGKEVNCIAPEFMLKFKTWYEPKEKDIHDVQALCEKFGFTLPDKYMDRKGFTVLETPRLILRPLTLADAETAYYGWTGDEDANKWVSWLPHHSLEDAVEWLKEIDWQQATVGDTPRDNYIWGFVLKEKNKLFGSGGLIWEEDCGLYQVGYNISQSYWNKGYTTEAMRAILKYAANILGIKRVAGGHAKENLASKKVLEKLGFVYDRDDITPHIGGVRVLDSREYTLDLETGK